MVFELLLHRPAQSAGALAVDDGHCAQLVHQGVVQKAVYRQLRLVGHQAPQVQLRAGGPALAGADGGGHMALGGGLRRLLRLLDEAHLAGVHRQLHVPSRQRQLIAADGGDGSSGPGAPQLHQVSDPDRAAGGGDGFLLLLETEGVLRLAQLAPDGGPGVVHGLRVRLTLLGLPQLRQLLEHGVGL